MIEAAFRRSAARAGFIGAVAVVYSCLVGMVEQLSTLAIVGSKLTLAWVLLLIPPVLAGYFAGRPQVRKGERVEPGRLTAILAGGVAGAITGAGLVVGIGLANLIGVDTVQRVMRSASAALFAILAFHGPTARGCAMLMVLLTALGFCGGALRSLDIRWRRPVVSATVAALVFGALQRVIPPALDQSHIERDWLYSRATLGLTLQGAAIVGAIAAAATFLHVGRRLRSVLFPGRASMSNAAGDPTESTIAPEGVVGQATGGERHPLDARFTSPQIAAIAGWVVIGGILIVLPYIVGPVVARTLDTVGIFLLLGLGLNIVVGFAGLLDLGYVAFYSVGAFLTAILTGAQRNTFVGLRPPDFGAHLSFYVAIVIVVVVAAVIGVLIGAPVLRLRGDYLAIVTLGFGEIARVIFGSTWAQGLFGGSAGMTGITKAPIAGFQFQDDARHFYYLVLAFCLLVIFVSWRLQDSRIGRAWNAMREDEQVAGAMGISTTKFKLLAFAIGGAIGSTGGALFAVSIGSLQIASFQIFVSITALAIVILGGLGSIPGVVVGALVLIGLPGVLSEFQSYQLLIYGGVLVAIMLLRPQGLVPNVRRTRELRAEDRAQDQWAQVPAAREEPAAATTGDVATTEAGP